MARFYIDWSNIPEDDDDCITYSYSFTVPASASYGELMEAFGETLVSDFEDAHGVCLDGGGGGEDGSPDLESGVSMADRSEGDGESPICRCLAFLFITKLHQQVTSFGKLGQPSEVEYKAL
jgi:hypothetical protein